MSCEDMGGPGRVRQCREAKPPDAPGGGISARQSCDARCSHPTTVVAPSWLSFAGQEIDCLVRRSRRVRRRHPYTTAARSGEAQTLDYCSQNAPIVSPSLARLLGNSQRETTCDDLRKMRMNLACVLQMLVHHAIVDFPALAAPLGLLSRHLVALLGMG